MCSWPSLIQFINAVTVFITFSFLILRTVKFSKPRRKYYNSGLQVKKIYSILTIYIIMFNASRKKIVLYEAVLSELA